MKVVIPVAGLGTLNVTCNKSNSKRNATIADKPLIQYIVNECVAAGH